MAAYRFFHPPSFVSDLKPFRPLLRFADGLFSDPKLPLLTYSNPKPSIHLSRANQRFPLLTNNRSRIAPKFALSSRPRCFRCGVIGHVVKLCRALVRCFLCGGYGHKSFRCYKHSPLRSGASRKDLKVQDDSWRLQVNPSLEVADRDDCFLLDPDVVNCSGGFLEPAKFASNALAPSDLGPSMEVLGDSWKIVDISEVHEGFQVPCSPDPVEAASREQIQLVLSPVHFEDITRIEIIDDVEVAYSDEVEPSAVSDSEYSSDSFSKPKLLGKKDAKVKEDACNQSLEIAGVGKKNPKVIKKGFRPVMLCSVRRSPRFSKGLPGLR